MAALVTDMNAYRKCIEFTVCPANQRANKRAQITSRNRCASQRPAHEHRSQRVSDIVAIRLNWLWALQVHAQGTMTRNDRVAPSSIVHRQGRHTQRITAFAARNSDQIVFLIWPANPLRQRSCFAPADVWSIDWARLLRWQWLRSGLDCPAAVDLVGSTRSLVPDLSYASASSFCFQTIPAVRLS